MEHAEYLGKAIEEAFEALRSGDGGPFGAVIVRKGKIIGRGHNTVLADHDPTAHAEVNAIRDACRRIGEHHLTDAVIYSNFEPCPMCLAAIYWADIRVLYFSAGREEAERAGFMDKALYHQFSLPADKREILTRKLEHVDMVPLLEKWDDMEDRILY
jgi:guanine deaminase